MAVNVQRTAAFALLISAVAALVGCQSKTGLAGRSRAAPALAISAAKRDALSQELRVFADYAESQVAAVADDIQSHRQDSKSLRAALSWKIEFTSEMDASRAVHEPVEMLVDTWTLLARLLEYFTVGDGKDLFGERQQSAIAVVRELGTRFEALARRHIPKDALPKLTRQAEAFARAHPIRGLFVLGVSEELQKKQPDLMRLLKLPFTAVGAFGKRLDPTASLAQSVDRFTALMEDYPSLLRWQAQLLASQIEQTPTIKSDNGRHRENLVERRATVSNRRSAARETARTGRRATVRH